MPTIKKNGDEYVSGSTFTITQQLRLLKLVAEVFNDFELLAVAEEMIHQRVQGIPLSEGQIIRLAKHFAYWEAHLVELKDGFRKDAKS